ncbi:putative AAA ATPase [Methanocella paludicola SANAE]|uniref:AAA ATPase n=1 Tax=Methanocella paludicola (strain DSM 17711 / JCM 13418 / NBRC 101707 / SANAE) TaxID=304371 RepID=D1YWX3_METPS|nr:MoxR family ATPase [Methanocella paludicola]BAI60945.1 putative AAA ATPase [Methanocella paludicola SANAE]
MVIEVNSKAASGINDFSSMVDRVNAQTRRAIIGKESLVFDIFTALLAGGNIMLEGVPGVAKTTIAKVFAASTGLNFKRIQFVPDIMPSDITGGPVFNQKTMEFNVYKGPIFTNLLLADEINRASPKIQSSLLEAMEEKQVSINGVAYPLPEPFMVIATENPIDIIGTFPLPEAQIDRFMFKLDIDYPDNDDELALLKSKNAGSGVNIEDALNSEKVGYMIDTVKRVYIDDKVLEYIRDLVIASRRHEKLLLGASPRASISFLKASKAVAALRGRDYVIPDDVKYLVPRVLNHRLIVKPEYEQEGMTVNRIVEDLMAAVKVPS